MLRKKINTGSMGSHGFGKVLLIREGSDDDDDDDRLMDGRGEASYRQAEISHGCTMATT